MKYTVIRKHRVEKLIVEVQAMIDKGWIPQGGVAVEAETNSVDEYCSQAMIHTGNPE